jgi:hypothetical protein
MVLAVQGVSGPHCAAPPPLPTKGVPPVIVIVVSFPCPPFLPGTEGPEPATPPAPIVIARDVVSEQLIIATGPGESIIPPAPPPPGEGPAPAPPPPPTTITAVLVNFAKNAGHVPHEID